MDRDPEIGTSIQLGTVVTNYHDIGQGDAVLFLHGSGPGVSAWANWRLPIADIGRRFRCIAPDLAGFGYSEVAAGHAFTRESWIDQLLRLLDALGIGQVHVVGNSFGGSLALGLAIRTPERVAKLVLMGSVGVPFDLTPGLDAVWGYTPSAENMTAVMRSFAHDPSLVRDDLVQMRLAASLRADVQTHYAAMFPAPRQRWVDAMAYAEEDIRAIPHSTLIIHGRDDRIIPLDTSLCLHQWIDDSELHVFGRCGHWTQIERTTAFNSILADFLTR